MPIATLLSDLFGVKFQQQPDMAALKQFHAPNAYCCNAAGDVVGICATKVAVAEVLFPAIPSLQYLNVGGNEALKTWTFKAPLPALAHFDISDSGLDGVFQLPQGFDSLTWLDAARNGLTEFVLQGNVPLLAHLDLSGNQLREFSIRLFEVPKLERLFLNNNPLISPPLEIVEQGNAAILRHFEELEATKAEDIRPLNEAKLIIIGQPRAGKTSLRYKLRDTERIMPKEEESTRGIDVEQEVFSYTDGESKTQEFKYHIWDFGGQQIYHATHRFFLTKRTIYVAVVDTDVNDKQNDLDYWLHMIELMGDGSPVILVQNQKNDRSIDISDALRNRFRGILVAKDYELNFDRLRKKDNSKFDAGRLRDFQNFKKDIHRLFEQQVPIPMTPAKSNTREALERLSKEKPLVEMAEYRSACIENGLNDPLAQMDLLRTLHNLGICLWYEGYDFLDRIVILQNRWATDAVFKVLDNETVKKNKGHFLREELNQIWTAAEYQDRVSELVALMKQFKLCYQIGQTDAYIAPQLLDKNPPKDFSRADIQGSVRMVIEYEFMPRGIMTQFIVAMHRQISGGQRHVWETGFAIESQNGLTARGMAEESYDSRKLELWAKGSGAALLLQQMLGELEKIHDTFHQRLRYNKLIPCNCAHCSAPTASRIKEFEYDEILLEMYQNRQSGIRCSYGNTTVSFSQLLGELGFTSEQMERDFRKNERRGEERIEINVNLPPPSKPSSDEDKPLPQTDKTPRMKNIKWIWPVLILIVLFVFFSLAKPGSKVNIPGWLEAEQGGTPPTTLPEPSAPSHYTIQVPIKINGQVPDPAQIGYMRPQHAPTLTAELTSGGLFTFRGLEIPKDKLLIFELFYKNGHSAGLAQAQFVEANSNGVSVLTTVQFHGTLDKKRNQYINITVAPEFKVQNSNTVGDGNTTSQQ
ncbi:MAG: COR domain-containing protein [Saprospiraceae bacterium]